MQGSRVQPNVQYLSASRKLPHCNTMRGTLYPEQMLTRCGRLDVPADCKLLCEEGVQFDLTVGSLSLKLLWSKHAYVMSFIAPLTLC